MPTLGARPFGREECEFLVWAPFARTVELQIETPVRRLEPMQKGPQGYFRCTTGGVPAGSTYFYRLDGSSSCPDPASRSQPHGVHGPSEVRSAHFDWNDSGWKGIPLDRLVIDEIHVGTFTPQGTFDAIIPRLPALKQLGVNTIELMPVAQFPGERNWGYDGVYPYAVQNSYGGPDGLRRLVNACHSSGLCVALDVVYNHLGPEGNYLRNFGSYFTDRYKTPWGEAINFDGPFSDHVRQFFIGNALYWVSDFHVDALRLDAIHAIVDTSAVPFLEELAREVGCLAARLGRAVEVIAESDLNDSRIVRPREVGGFGCDAQWNDDFHHALHALLTREKTAYYESFGSLEHLATAFRSGFVYSGQHSAYRERRYGNSSLDVPARRFVVFTQNHDQVGNRAQGDRLSAVVDFEKLKLAAGVVLLSPFVPLLFMGEEYGETSPFQYFVSHGDQSLIEAVRRGRREEFARFGWQQDIPDPQSEETFERSRPNWSLRDRGKHLILRKFYTDLLSLRRSVPALSNLSKTHMKASVSTDCCLVLERWREADRIFATFNFAERTARVVPPSGVGSWRKIFDSAETCWAGPGGARPESFEADESAPIEIPALSFALFRRSTDGDSIDSAA
jgi:maltooligosyltrehalose trehalohydrolase